MSLLRTETQREVEMLQNVEEHLERHRHREHVHHVLFAGLAFLGMATFIGCHIFGHRCLKKHC